MDEHNEDRRGFQVRDRRRFTESGEAREAVPEEPAEPSERADVGAPPLETGRPERAAALDAPVTFSTFVLGLSTQALLHLGEIEDPVSRRIERDLEGAKQLIDILGILREKTRNNLEQGEENLLDSILYDLRMRYVALVRTGTKEET